VQLDHVGIVVGDLEAAKRFATEVLGLELEREGPQPALGVQTAFFRAGPALLEFVQLDDVAKGEEKLAGQPARIDHLALKVDDLGAAHDRLAAHGASFDQDEPLRLGPNDNYFSRADTTHGIRLQLMRPADD
jgi:catechol 2,3-dioxygenase-like lactoylglutathione lyase family enzyme